MIDTFIRLALPFYRFLLCDIGLMEHLFQKVLRSWIVDLVFYVICVVCLFAAVQRAALGDAVPAGAGVVGGVGAAESLFGQRHLPDVVRAAA